MQSDIFSEIIINNVIREKNTLSKYACESRKGIRKFQEEIPDRKNIRPTFFHDTDRIIHSKAYSRYIDKTQVFYLFKNDHITHRVLHVQLVSKIARVIGRALKLNEDLIEAIALGHDLGHVPYGHDGEAVLHKICMEHEIGCFYHNAQSVKFLLSLENNGKGLNLTLQVLDGILSHNGELLEDVYEPNTNKDWNVFQEEYDKCFFIENFYKKIKPMTLEGCVVRISDVIAYIGRDFEDAITVKLIKREDIPELVVKTLGNTNGNIINTLTLDLIKNSFNCNHLRFSKSIFEALQELMAFNYKSIYKNQTIRTQHSIIENMFGFLFEKLLNDILLNNSSSPILKDYLINMNEDYLANTCDKRKVIDFISGMTDNYFNNLFKLYFIPKSYGYRVSGKK